MTQVVVTVSAEQVGPVLLFVVVTMFCIIGNVVKGFEMNMSFSGTASDAFLDLWAIGACSNNICARMKISDFDSTTGGSCSGAVHHLKAAAAFGIITSVLSGVSTCCAILFFMRNNITPPRVFGILLGSLNALFTLIAFILYITVLRAECIKNANIDPNAGPFMYLGAFLFSVAAIAVYAMQSSGRGEANYNRNPSPTHQARVMEPRPAGRPAPLYHQPVAQQQPRTPSPQRPQPVTASATKRAVPLPPTAVSAPPPASAAPNAARDELWPDGNDWVVDESSGLLWSEEKHLFFDRESGQFFDPKSDQWYDPEGNRWYKIQ